MEEDKLCTRLRRLQIDALPLSGEVKQARGCVFHGMSGRMARTR